MFTGIIEEIGIVKQLVPGKVSYRLTVSANKVLEGTQVGDSIATNGICLTVTAIHGNNFDGVQFSHLLCTSLCLFVFIKNATFQ